MKSRLKGFYVGGTLYWLVVASGFKYLGSTYSVNEGLRMIREDYERDIERLRRAREDW